MAESAVAIKQQMHDLRLCIWARGTDQMIIICMAK